MLDWELCWEIGRKKERNTRQGAYNQWEMLWYDFEMSDFYPRSLNLSRFQQIVQGNKQKCTPKTREFPQKSFSKPL